LEDQSYPKSNDLFYLLNSKEPKPKKCSLKDSSRSANYQSLESKRLLNIRLKEACSSLYHWQQVWFHFEGNGSYLGIWYEDGCCLAW